ncbi:MAG: hypothetical protein ACJAU6_001681 [Alphaproteobacteria bacterium]|jgi:hypothetical protein
MRMREHEPRGAIKFVIAARNELYFGAQFV